MMPTSKCAISIPVTRRWSNSPQLLDALHCSTTSSTIHLPVLCLSYSIELSADLPIHDIIHAGVEAKSARLNLHAGLEGQLSILLALIVRLALPEVLWDIIKISGQRAQDAC